MNLMSRGREIENGERWKSREFQTFEKREIHSVKCRRDNAERGEIVSEKGRKGENE